MKLRNYLAQGKEILDAKGDLLLENKVYLLREMKRDFMYDQHLSPSERKLIHGLILSLDQILLAEYDAMKY